MREARAPAGSERDAAKTERKFPWGAWALVGAIAWVAAMVVLGTPALALLAPVTGVMLGWALGGIAYLVLSSTRRRESR